jgi:hypothetical protein
VVSALVQQKEQIDEITAEAGEWKNRILKQRKSNITSSISFLKFVSTLTQSKFM